MLEQRVEKIEERLDRVEERLEQIETNVLATLAIAKKLQDRLPSTEV